MKRRDQPAHPRRPAERRRQREAVLAGAGPGGDPSRPGHGVHSCERLMRRRALAELRQVEDRHRRRTVDHRPRHPRARDPSPAPGHRRWRRCAPPRPSARRHRATLVSRSAASRPSWSSRTTSPGSSASRDGGSRKDAVSRPTHSSSSARRQRRSASPAGVAMAKVSEVTRSAEPVARRASTLIASYSSSERTSCHFSACGSSVSCARTKLEDLGVGVRTGHQVVEAERRHRPPVARLEADHALALDRVEAELPRQRRDRGARAFQRGDQICRGRHRRAPRHRSGCPAARRGGRARGRGCRARPSRGGRSASGRAASCRRRSRRRSRAGKAGNGRASQVQAAVSAVAIIRPE